MQVMPQYTSPSTLRSEGGFTDDLPEINYQPLSLEEATISDIERIWDREGSSHDARIELIFNQPVTPDALAEQPEPGNSYSR